MLAQLCVMLSALILSTTLWAEELFPPQCKATMVKEDLVQLQFDKPALLMMHNLSDADLWLSYQGQTEATAPSTSRIKANHWAALAVYDTKLELACIESRPGHEQQLPCPDVLALCSWGVEALPKDKALQSRWAAEDMPLSELLAYIGRMGYAVS